MLRAIETRYKGRRFRSRLEARYAVMFDHLGIEWDYEPEGFELQDGTRYLPDFWITCVGWHAPGVWLEVKATIPTAAEGAKLAAVGRESGRAALFLVGPADRMQLLMVMGGTFNRIPAPLNHLVLIARGMPAMLVMDGHGALSAALGARFEFKDRESA